MWGAAPRKRRNTTLSIVLALLAFGLAAGSAEARLDSPTKSTLPDAELWAVQVSSRSTAALKTTAVARYRAQGFNALVVLDARKLGKQRLARVRTAAAKARLRLLTPIRVGGAAPRQQTLAAASRGRRRGLAAP